MEVETLKYLIVVALGVLLGLWGSIGYSLIYRRYRRKNLQQIEAAFAEVLSSFLYGPASEKIDFLHIQRVFRKLGIREEKPQNVQYLIDLMIRTQRFLLGRNHKRLQKLYEQLPPYRASYKKTLNWQWHIQARGIREIYEMNQPQYTSYIFRFRDHPNIYVRREAQIALVVFLGWESLRFLPYLTRKQQLWQQIKIVEKLHDLYPEPRLEYIRNAYKIKNDFGRQLIMRIIRKYELQEETDFLVSQLSHPAFEVRETAIDCLSSFLLTREQLDQVKLIFPQLDLLKQQKQVLNLIQKSSPDLQPDLPFYRSLLFGSPEMLKLHVAEILWTNGHSEMVQEYYLSQYTPNKEIPEISNSLQPAQEPLKI